MHQTTSLVCDALRDVKVVAILPRLGILATQYSTSNLPSHISVSELPYAEPDDGLAFRYIGSILRKTSSCQEPRSASPSQASSIVFCVTFDPSDLIQLEDTAN